ncbi:unnamed protein product [Lampetra planeri]
MASSFNESCQEKHRATPLNMEKELSSDPGGGQGTFFQSRTMASDLEVLILIPSANRSSTTAEGPGDKPLALWEQEPIRPWMRSCDQALVEILIRDVMRLY